MKTGIIRAICTFCVLALAALLLEGCLTFVYENQTPMYEISRIKAYFEKTGFVYLALFIVLVLTGIMNLFRKKTPEKQKKSSEYRHAKPISPRRRTAVRLFLLAMAILLIVPGIMNGGLYDVFVKAVNICTECIGLG